MENVQQNVNQRRLSGKRCISIRQEDSRWAAFRVTGTYLPRTGDMKTTKVKVTGRLCVSTLWVYWENGYILQLEVRGHEIHESQGHWAIVCVYIMSLLREWIYHAIRRSYWAVCHWRQKMFSRKLTVLFEVCYNIKGINNMKLTTDMQTTYAETQKGKCQFW